ncbi:hypothetical protein N9K16_05585 [Alphaproteobacteria bacterium]|nr:hypothetical protein [Alphaproteobacteria bacterium]
MSTTFDVIPTSRIFVTFGEFLSLAEQHLGEFLKGIGVNASLTIRAELVGEIRRDFQPHELVCWPENCHAWFSIDGLAGGTDVYCRSIHDPPPELKKEEDIAWWKGNHDPWWLLEEIICSPNKPPNLEQMIVQAKKLDRRWNFRRSMGQPAIINLTYGLLAASLAELTGGLVSSGDSAWCHLRFPATSEEFFTWYFRPGLALEHDKAD